MKVVCIDDTPKLENGCFAIKKGNIYHVINETIVDNWRKGNRVAEKGIYYQLIEAPHWYHHSLFI